MLRRLALAVVGLAGLSLSVASCLGVENAAADPPTGVGDAGSDADAHTLGDGAWACTPKTCADLGANCGDVGNGCSAIINCGTCPTGQNCGAAGPNKCGEGTCTPSTCATLGAECGAIGDGCGKALDCGVCPAPKICGASGQANVCGCVPTTCAAQGKDCGNIPDGCGGTLACGTCPTGKKCGAGGTANVCACEPTTCAAQGKECGSIPDGCGGTLSCGTCAAPKTCGGLGVANMCGCSPANCPPIYQNSFESPGDFPSGWVSWQNCPTDTSWSVARDNYPAPGGGSWNLRLHSTGFVPSCAFPGVYAVTPPVTAQPGRVYRIHTTTRNAGSLGETQVLFMDGADKEIGFSSVKWATDAWQYNADPVLTATSPAGTQALRVRLALLTPSEYADVDLLEVYLEP